MFKEFFSELKRRQVIKPLVAYLGISWLILQIVGVIATLMPVHPLIGPITLFIVICGFPIVCYLSWHFDFSLEGITRTPSLDSELNPKLEPFGPRNWFGLLIIVVISSFIAYQNIDAINQQQLAAKEGMSMIKTADSIAVLPFTDQSPEQDQAYLALGLAAEITGLLGSADGFKVSASRSSQILVEKGFTPIDIGKRLNVNTVLTGSVRTNGNRLRVRLELIDTGNGRTLWTQSFLREMTDVFELESEISRAVVNLLQDRYLEAGALTSLSTTESVDAYVMYLKGREEYRKQTTEAMKQARSLFEQALALDPEYAKAYAALADTIASLSEGPDGFGVLKTDIAAQLAEANLEKAIVRQPELPEIYAVMGVVKILRNEFDESLALFDKALELNSSLAIALLWKAISLNELQRFDEAIAAQQKAVELDPLFSTGLYNLGMMLTWRGRDNEAKAIFEQIKHDHPKSTFSHQGLADLYFSQGNYVASLQEAKHALALSPDNEDLEFRLYVPLLQLGLVDIVKQHTSNPRFENTIMIFEGNFDALFEKMEFEVAADPDNYWVAFEAGWYLAMFGSRDKALPLLSQNHEQLHTSEKFTMPYCSPAIELAWAFAQQGDDVLYHSHLNDCEKLFNKRITSSIVQPELAYLGARIQALKGNSSQALQYLQTAIDSGWREWWTKHDPLLARLANEAQFVQLIANIDSELAMQRQAAKQLFQE